MRVILATALAAALSLTSCNNRPTEPRVTASDVWVQLPAIEGRPGSAYFTLETNNDPTKLVSVSSPSAQRIELHETVTENGIARMRPAVDLTFKDYKLVFAPGGAHAMLFGLDPALKAGDRIRLTFNVEPAPPLTAEAEVRAFGAGRHAEH